jgi:hypothetical protein
MSNSLCALSASAKKTSRSKERESTMSEPLLRIHNRHTADCGDPPIISSDNPNLYIGYFENSSGEQWIFTFDRGTRKAELRCGDVGWNDVHEIVDGKAVGLLLSGDEAMWLQACWRSAGSNT